MRNMYRLTSTFPRDLPMAWCTCPIRCKGGCKVADSTRARHQKEFLDRELDPLRAVRENIPDRVTPLSNPSRKIQRSDDNGTHGTCSKRTRVNHGSGDETGTPFVRALAGLSPLELTSQ